MNADIAAKTPITSALTSRSCTSSNRTRNIPKCSTTCQCPRLPTVIGRQDTGYRYQARRGRLEGCNQRDGKYRIVIQIRNALILMIRCPFRRKFLCPSQLFYLNPRLRLIPFPLQHRQVNRPPMHQRLENTLVSGSKSRSLIPLHAKRPLRHQKNTLLISM